jgi:N6-adenosine-specific RNA methylase IME4
MAQAPEKRYRTIVADPPWRYNVKPPEGGTPYATMTPQEMANLPIGMWAEERAHLYLWTTNSFLVEAHRVMDSWGFEYKTLITWVKRRPVNDNWIGLGFYYRGVTEHVLFGVRNGLGVLRKNQPNLFYAPHRDHSEKPDTFYDIVESMSLGPYLDVFARKQRMGWDTFGDEAFNFGTDLPPEHFVAQEKND